MLQASLKEIKKWEEQIILIFFALLPFYRIFFGEALLGRDLSLNFIPSKAIIWDSIYKFHEFPLWNPFIDGGTPFLQDLTASPLHPFNLVLLLFPRVLLPVAATLILALASTACALGMRALCLKLGIDRFLASILALALAWSGPLISGLMNPQCLLSFCVAPGVFWAFFCWKEDGDSKWMFLSSALLAFSFLGGDPAQTYVLILCIFFLLLAEDTSKKSILFFISTLLLSLLIIAPQLPSLAEGFVNSDRFGVLQNPFKWTFHPHRLLELIWPHAYGHIMDIENFKGQALIGTNEMIGFYIWDFHSGWLFPIGLIAAVFQIKKINRRGTYFLGAGVFLLFLSMGYHSPIDLWRIFCEYLPAWKSFRYPERLVLWPIFFGYLFIGFFLKFVSTKKIYRFAVICLLGIELVFVSTRSMAWGEVSKICAPTSLVKAILADSTQRGPSVANGFQIIFAASHRPWHNFIDMFSDAWAHLHGNLPGYFGIHSTSYYASYQSMEKKQLEDELKKHDEFDFFRLKGGRYIYDENTEKTILIKNDLTIPKLFVASKWHLDNKTKTMSENLQQFVFNNPNSVVLSDPANWNAAARLLPVCCLIIAILYSARSNN